MALARALATWEALEPLPPAGFEPGGAPERDPRFGRARTAERFVRWLSPDLFTAHPMAAELPEEEILLMGPTFQTALPSSSLDIPRHLAWTEGRDQAPAYRWLANCLRALGVPLP